MDLSGKRVVSNWHNLFLWQSCKLMDNREAIDVINISITFFFFLYSLRHSHKYAKKIWSALIPCNMAEQRFKKISQAQAWAVPYQSEKAFQTDNSNPKNPLLLVNIFTDDLNDWQHGRWRTRKIENEKLADNKA